jgi:hypothetical protein
MLYHLFKVNQCFRGTGHLHLQVWRISHLLSHCFHALLILWLWCWRRNVPLKRRLPFNGL